MALSTIELKLPVPAIQGYFGDRLASYATQATAQSIVALLGHDPRSKSWKQLLPEVREIYEFLQRKTAKNRRDSLSGYMEDRFAPDAITIGAFPAISIGFIRPLEFEQSSDSGVGTLKIDLSPSTARVMLDGLGRVTAALDLLDEGRTEILDNMVFPVTIFAPKPGQKPLSYKELGQLFHDMNFKVQPVSKSHAVALDTSDLYITFASRIGEAAVISENGGVAERAASLGKKSTELVVQTVLVRFVRGALEGRTFQESNMATTESPNLTRETFATEMERLEGFLEAFADEMGSAFGDRDSLHLTSPGWQALGVFYNDIAHRLSLETDQLEEYARAAGRLDWSRYNADWIPMLGQAEIDKFTGSDVVDHAGRKRVSIAGAGRSNVQNILDYVRKKTGIADLLEVPLEETLNG